MVEDLEVDRRENHSGMKKKVERWNGVEGRVRNRTDG